MEKRVETSAALAKMITKKEMSFLGNIITMDAHSRNKNSV
jgi:hypothetical protein